MDAEKKFKIEKAVGTICRLLNEVLYVSDMIYEDVIEEYRRGAKEIVSIIKDGSDDNRYNLAYLEARKWASSLHSMVSEYGNEFCLVALNALLDNMDYEIGPYIG